ncbi:MAG: transposase [Bacilli bacterium]
MSKLSYEDKVEIYKKNKSGITINVLSKIYKVNNNGIKYLIDIIDLHGIDIIRRNTNKSYDVTTKLRIINRVLINNESINSVAIDEGLSSRGMLSNWIKNYKENSYNIVEQKRGRSSTMKKEVKQNINETTEEKIKRLELENQYLKAEIEYSKKLKAVVQARRINNRRKSKCC